MRNLERWLASALMAALVLAGAAVAQPPERQDGPPRVFGQPGRLGPDDILEHILAFDRNKDGKVGKDELSERMQHLIARGDTNKDGALDRDEIKKLASTPGGFGPTGGLGFGQGGIPGPGPVFGIAGPGPGRIQGGIAGPGPGNIGGVVDDLKLSGKKKDQAMAAVKTHEENVRKLMDQARAELLKKMQEILSEVELDDFKAALDRPRGRTTINLGPPDAPRPGGFERKLDQKEPDGVRR